MITDEERRRVAMRMYEAADGTVFKGNSFCAMLARMTRAKEATRRSVMHRLADLIDRPTCTIVHSWQEITPGLDELDLSDMCGFELSCGHEVQGYEKPKYCSKCRAVVVDED